MISTLQVPKRWMAHFPFGVSLRAGNRVCFRRHNSRTAGRWGRYICSSGHDSSCMLSGLAEQHVQNSAGELVQEVGTSGLSCLTLSTQPSLGLGESRASSDSNSRESSGRGKEMAVVLGRQLVRPPRSPGAGALKLPTNTYFPAAEPKRAQESPRKFDFCKSEPRSFPLDPRRFPSTQFAPGDTFPCVP